jgi:glutamine amidotransferase
MGWNTAHPKKEAPLCKNLTDEPRFYFAHSHHVVCNDASDVLLTTFYGLEFASSIQRDNIVGVQFHPEKSHRFGMTLLRNFVGT